MQPADVPGNAGWMGGGCYLVARRIRMHIEVWDRSNLQDQEQTIGRTKREGAPLGQQRELDPVDFHKPGADGQPAIPPDAHVRLTHPDNLGGVQILRRGYNFTDGTDGVGHLDAGLFFVAFARDVHRQFVPMQKALAGSDAMNEYIEHTGSAFFACPPGLSEGMYWGSPSSPDPAVAGAGLHVQGNPSGLTDRFSSAVGPGVVDGSVAEHAHR